MALRADDPRFALTAAEWAEMEDPPGHRFQVIRGELDVTPGPAPEHGTAVGEIYGALRRELPEGFRLTIDSDWHLMAGARVAAAPRPDLLVIPREGPIVPILAVEVLSPSDHHRFRGTDLTRIQAKRLDYADAGLRHYLEVDLHAATIMRYELDLRDLEADELVVVDSVVDDDVLSAMHPFPYTLYPSALT
jgi:Uma2 family endonuclease